MQNYNYFLYGQSKKYNFSKKNSIIRDSGDIFYLILQL